MLAEKAFKDFVRRLCYCVVAFLLVSVLWRITLTLQHPFTHLFFPMDRERFIEVDRGTACGHRSVVAADRETGVLYLFIEDGGVSPLFQSDGELMIYDAG